MNESRLATCTGYEKIATATTATGGQRTTTQERRPVISRHGIRGTSSFADRHGQRSSQPPSNHQPPQPTAEQRQAIEAFAASDMPQLFVGGLTVLDVESLLAEIASATGVQLRAEYAVWHLAEGQTDRACWILKGGV